MKICMIVGARPNFIKMCPVYRTLRRTFNITLIHTGQHYDNKMSKVFFDQLDIPKPDIQLVLHSKNRAGILDDKLYINNTEYMNMNNKQNFINIINVINVINDLMTLNDLGQLGEIRDKLYEIYKNINPSLVIVFGDVTSTLAGTIAAKLLNIPVAHIEAGLRSGDLSMPEEVNRILTDHMSTYHFVTEQSGIDNLRKENLNGYLVGNTMLECMDLYKIKALETESHKKINGEYILLTLHRPSNVDNMDKLNAILADIGSLNTQIIFPVHPRLKHIHVPNNIQTCDPLGYLEFICLMANAKFIITDSGGIQEESTHLNIPCFTLRDNTERPSTLVENGGTNRLIKSVRDIGNINEIKIKIKNKNKINNPSMNIHNILIQYIHT